MADLHLVVDASRVRIRTFAEGLFARLAHDLELVAKPSGTATRAERGGTATLEFPLHAIEVAGVLGKDGRIDASAMSASDRRDCLAKMHADVFRANASAVVRVEVHVEGTSARVRIVPPNGKSVEKTTTVTIREGEDRVVVTGTVRLSLSALGSATVKGPMNAFRVKDEIEVLFDGTFAPKT